MTDTRSTEPTPVRVVPATEPAPRIEIDNEGPLVSQPGSEDDPLNQGDFTGTDPVYQNFASDAGKPFPFSDEEKGRAAERGGVTRTSAAAEGSGFAGPAAGNTGGPDEGGDTPTEPEVGQVGSVTGSTRTTARTGSTSSTE